MRCVLCQLTIENTTRFQWDAQVTIQEGAAAELRETVDVEGGPSDRRAVYELCAAVHHVQDADEEPGRASASEGHLIAHIQVPPAPIRLDEASNGL